MSSITTDAKTTKAHYRKTELNPCTIYLFVLLRSHSHLEASKLVWIIHVIDFNFVYSSVSLAFTCAHFYREKSNLTYKIYTGNGLFAITIQHVKCRTFPSISRFYLLSSNERNIFIRFCFFKSMHFSTEFYVPFQLPMNSFLMFYFFSLWNEGNYYYSSFSIRFPMIEK